MRVRGLVVMIVACQVMDPGSIPGERIFFLSLEAFLCTEGATGFCLPQVFPNVCGNQAAKGKKQSLQL